VLIVEKSFQKAEEGLMYRDYDKGVLKYNIFALRNIEPIS